MGRIKLHNIKKRLKIQKGVGIGIILLAILMSIAAYIEVVDITKMAGATMDILKKQCISFDKLMVADRTKSLFRLTNMLRDLSDHLEEEQVSDEYLEQYADNMHISGILLLNKDLELEASGYSKKNRSDNRQSFFEERHFEDIIRYPEKKYAERIEIGEEYYDVCAVARKDEAGIILGFYKQPKGLISGKENDLEKLMGGLDLDREGKYAVVENGNVRATNVQSMKHIDVSQSTVLQKISAVPKDRQMHLIHADRRFYWGYHSGCEGYSIYIYYPVFMLLSPWFMTAVAFVAAYFVLCFVHISVRNKMLFENQEMLKKSNSQLTETVKMLRALETIYFTLFYVDLDKNRYDTIYLAPWLENAIPHKGMYTELKKVFLEKMVEPSYREEVNNLLSNEFIRESLSLENTTGERKSFYTDYQAIRGDELKWCRVSATVVDYDDTGKPVHVLALLQDVDKEKAKEAEYQEKILKEAQEAKVANNAKTEFLRRISHDIRTPLNGIQGYVNMAAKHPEDIQMQIHCRENATKALHTLLELFNSIIDMSKLENNNIVIEDKPFNLAELLDELDVIIKPHAENANINYEAFGKNELPYSNLIGSPRHVSQILLNLATNAVKYGKTGGYIRMHTHLVSNTENEATYEFICEDNGIGMSKEFQKRLFEPFVQEAVNARTTYEGAGLGLSIVKKIVDALGGTITFQSEKDVGTTFRILLTFRIDRQYEDSVSDCSNIDADILKGANVLLVEDNELNMEIAECMLEDCGANVTKAWNGQEAVDIFAASEAGFFDLIFMDIMMPVMNGLKATRAIRALERPDAKTVAISAMSANAFQDDIRMSREAGMNEHIAKPVDDEKFLMVATKLLTKKTV